MRTARSLDETPDGENGAVATSLVQTQGLLYTAESRLACATTLTRRSVPNFEFCEAYTRRPDPALSYVSSPWRIQ